MNRVVREAKLADTWLRVVLDAQRHRKRRVVKRRVSAARRAWRALDGMLYEDAHDRWEIDSECRAYEGDSTW